MEQLVSIIMPVYNAGEYIESAIRSVLSQDYKNWELIIINDGSNDNSLEIIKNFSFVDTRITYLSIENQGVSVARNIGLSHAKGSLVVFCDADDLLPENSISIRVQLIEESDLGIGNYTKLYPDNEPSIPVKCPCTKWEHDTLIYNILTGVDYGYQGFLWNKIFRQKIIEDNGIRFVDGLAYNEDRAFCYMYALKCKSASLSNESVYYYRVLDNSTMGMLNNITISELDRLENEFKGYEVLKTIARDNYRHLWYIQYDETMSAIMMKNRINKKEKVIHRYLKKVIYNNGFQAILRDDRDLKKKIKLVGHVLLMK